MLHRENIKYIVLLVLRWILANNPFKIKSLPSRGSLEQELNRLDPDAYEPSDLVYQPEKGIDVSIIIPVYNTEAYLEDCLNSIMRQQTSCNVEVLIIDDGSNDGSVEVMERYCNIPNVKVIHQENRGFSGARNRGLDEARGKYVMFVDSDDLLEVNAVEALYIRAESCRADIVSGGYRTFPVQEELHIPSEREFEVEDWSGKMQMNGFLCGKLFRRELFWDIRLPRNLLFEDTIFHLLLIPLSKRAATVATLIFQYRIHENSISNSHQKSGKSLDSYWVVRELLRQRDALHIKRDASLYRFLLYQLSHMTYRRTYFYSLKTRKLLFYLCSYLIKTYEIPGVSLNRAQCYVQKAFHNRNYWLWEVCSRINRFDKELDQF